MRKSQVFGVLAGGLLTVTAVAADDGMSEETGEAGVVRTVGDGIVEKLKEGKIKGTIGTYMEAVEFDEDQGSKGDSFSWGTGYLKLGYTSGQYYGFTLGAEFLAHFELWSSDDDKAGFFHKDIEDGSEFSMPQLWLKYNFTEKTEIVGGRWEHKKFTHFDDVQAEGVYFRTRDLVEDVDFTLGFATAFAELDYDDGEDWDKKSQNFDENEYYGEDSCDMVIFSELVYTGLPYLTVNPFAYVQREYAEVYGLDLDGSFKLTDNVTLGARSSTVWIDGHDMEYQGATMDQADAFTWSVTPYCKVNTDDFGKFTIEGGYASFDGDDDALNKPIWLRDYIIDVLDQDRVYGADDCDVIFGRVKWALGDFWVHYAVGYYHDIDMGIGMDEGRVTENEVQFGYKITKNIDVNLRLFDVDYNYESGGNSKDYQKAEFRGRIKF